MLYTIGKAIFALYFYMVYRIKVTGKENLPKTGGVVLCANHISYADPLVLGIVLPRKLHFMGKKEIFKNPLFSWVLKSLNVFPVDRNDAGVATLKQAVAILKEGKVMGIFAQGTRVSEIDVKNAKSGAALFALKAEAPVVPVGLKSTFKPFSKIEINVGKPITLEEYKGVKVRTEGLNQITENIMAEIKKLCE